MKKEILKLYENFLKEREGYGRPEGPSPANIHHFQKVPRHKDTEHWPASSKTFPYSNPKADIEAGDEMSEEDFNDLPESLSELFKFTQSPSDNTSFHRPPTYGAGAMGSFGKIEIWNTGDATEEEKLKSANRRKKLKVRGASTPSEFEDMDDIEEARVPNLRHRHTDLGWTTTKEPWANGMPTYDKKDIEVGDEVAEDPEESVVKEYADTDFSRSQLQKIKQGPKSDLNFWDFITTNNKYIMNDPDEKEKESEETNQRSDT